MIVVSDTSPICYLLLIGSIDVLTQLYGKVLIPEIVQKELTDARSPDIVQKWIQNPPQWLVIEPDRRTVGKTKGTKSPYSLPNTTNNTAIASEKEGCDIVAFTLAYTALSDNRGIHPGKNSCKSG